MQKLQPQLILCILPNTGQELYAAIKRIGETVIGVATQCVQSVHMGADVSHPPPGETDKPSFAALCGSMDARASRYAATIRAQTGRFEIIADLANMLEPRVKLSSLIIDPPLRCCGAKEAPRTIFPNG
ncbi:unnamed protein product [Rhizophagus irregularis]|nr:unnamed protein product [Rhizophagus irregularis]